MAVIEDNPLSETSINIYIPELKARGVYVYYQIIASDSSPLGQS